MILKPTNRGHEIGKPMNRVHEIGKPTNGGHEIGKPTNGGHEIGRPTNGGHESDSSERRMTHDWRYRRFGFVDCEVRSYQGNNRSTIITLYNDKVSQSMTNRLSNEKDRIGRLNSRWMSNQSEWMNEWVIVHREPFIYVHATLFGGHELLVMNLYSSWQLHSCRYWPYLILFKVSRFPDEYQVWNHVCSCDLDVRTEISLNKSKWKI